MCYCVCGGRDGEGRYESKENVRMYVSVLVCVYVCMRVCIMCLQATRTESKKRRSAVRWHERCKNK